MYKNQITPYIQVDYEIGLPGLSTVEQEEEELPGENTALIPLKSSIKNEEEEQALSPGITTLHKSTTSYCSSFTLYGQLFDSKYLTTILVLLLCFYTTSTCYYTITLFHQSFLI